MNRKQRRARSPRRHHRAGHRADPGLGYVVLFSRGVRRADPARDRLVARLDCRRHLHRAAGGRLDLAASRPRHRPPWRSAGTAGEFVVLCHGPDRRRSGAGFAGLSRRLGLDRPRHGHRTLRCGVRRARPHVRDRSAPAHHQSHAVRRLRQHGVLAAQCLHDRACRLAQCLFSLCGFAFAGGAAAANGGGAARVRASRRDKNAERQRRAGRAGGHS